MELSQIVMSILCGTVAVVCVGQISAWQYRRAERDAAAGRPVVVPASIRRAGRTPLGGWWRHGTVNIDQGQVMWTPRTPWGRSLVLGYVGVGARRAPAGPLRWQLPPAAVVMSCAEPADCELAMLPSSVKFLYRAQFL